MATQGLHQVQKQTQSLVLAPQLRQSLKILQVPTLDLRTTILEELQTNPVLEEVPGGEVSIEAETEASQNEGKETETNSEPGEVDSTPDRQEASESSQSEEEPVEVAEEIEF